MSWREDGLTIFASPCVSPGLPYSATLGNGARATSATPTGLRPQPRVALLGYSRERRASDLCNPNGVAASAQGCRTRLPWGNGARDLCNPNGVATQSPGLPYSATLGNGGRATSATPTGLRPQSPGLPYSATLGRLPIRDPTPTGLRPQPRVAVLGYPGDRRESPAQPQRGCGLSPEGCCTQLPLEGHDSSWPSEVPRRKTPSQNRSLNPN